MFPPIGGLVLSCLHGRTSAVLADFMAQIDRIPTDFVALECLEVNLRDPLSICGGIERAKGTVVCVIRGGGGPEDFAVFDHPRLLEAWRDKEAFKISALGHADDTTLLDRFSHKVAHAPTEAGKWIAEQVEMQWHLRACRIQAEQAVRDTAEVVKQATVEAEARAQQAQGQRISGLEKDLLAARARADQAIRDTAELVKQAIVEAEARAQQAQGQRISALEKDLQDARAHAKQAGATLEQTSRENSRLRDEVSRITAAQRSLQERAAPRPRSPWPRWVKFTLFVLVLGALLIFAWMLPVLERVHGPAGEPLPPPAAPPVPPRRSARPPRERRTDRPGKANPASPTAPSPTESLPKAEPPGPDGQ